MRVLQFLSALLAPLTRCYLHCLLPVGTGAWEAWYQGEREGGEG